MTDMTDMNARMTQLETDARTMQEDIAWLQKKIDELAAQLDFVRGKQRLQHGRLLKLERLQEEAQPDSDQAP